MGEVERNIVKQAVRFGQPIPERIKNQPKLKPELQLYFTAFLELETERHEGYNGIRPIPRSAVHQYARDYALNEEQTENLHYFVRKMDGVRMKD